MQETPTGHIRAGQKDREKRPERDREDRGRDGERDRSRDRVAELGALERERVVRQGECLVPFVQPIAEKALVDDRGGPVQ